MKASSLTTLEPATLANLINRRDRVETDLFNDRNGLACDAPSADSRSLAYRLIRVAENEGRLFVLRNVVHLIENDKAGQVRDFLMMHATRGAEDSWSGRVNDVARARHDGVLRAIRDIEQDIATI